ncbi:MAG: PilW family protein [Desulfopila sp.]
MYKQCPANNLPLFQPTKNQGFTLVEILLALAISGIIMSAIYGAYIAQQRTYLAQEDVVEMQQNIRAATYIMVNDLRMAGYANGSGAFATIRTADLNAVEVSFDLDGDGSTSQANEVIRYDLYPSDGILKLGRNEVNGGLGRQSVAENFDYLEFEYLDAQGNIETNINQIRAIRIYLLARAKNAARDFNNTGRTYSFPSGPQGPYDDNVRRRLYVTTVNLRNMGLE